MIQHNIVPPRARHGNGSNVRGGQATTEWTRKRKLKSEFPRTWKYLLENRATFEKREDGKHRGPSWYGHGRTQAPDVMSLPKLLTPDLAPIRAETARP